MSHLHTHIHGNLIDNPVFRTFENSESALCKFRIASSRRRLTQQKDQNGNDVWEDADRLYIDVECWGQLAINATASLKRGFPVSVCGKLVTETWEVDSDHPEKEKEMRSKIVLKAHHVAFELAHYQVSSVRSVPTGNTLDGQEPMQPKTMRDLADGSGSTGQSGRAEPPAHGSFQGLTDKGRVSAEDAVAQSQKMKKREPVGAAVSHGGAAKTDADSGSAEGDVPPF